MCLNRRRTQCNCVQPPAVQLCRRGNHFPCCETLPHVNLTPPPPPHVYFRSLICSARPLFSHFIFTMSLFLSSFYPISALFEYHLLTPCDRLTRTLLRLLSLKLSLPAIILYTGGCVALQREFACGMRYKQAFEVFDFTALK